MLMAATNVEVSNSQILYFETSCNNQMTRIRDWLIDFDASKKTSIKLVDNKSIVAEGMGNVIIQRKDDKEVVIKNLLLVPNM